ncbi:MAG: nuclear transport factor 2 family protein [Bacteroidota bacterium]
MRTLIMLVLVLLSFSVLDAAPVDSASMATVEALFAAFNAHDTEAMLKLVTDDVVWFTVAGDSMAKDLAGKEELGKWLTGYFRSLPTVVSTMEDAIANGPFVSMRERVRWQGKNGEKTQASIGVYEVVEGKIKRVWYYPSVK